MCKEVSREIADPGQLKELIDWHDAALAFVQQTQPGKGGKSKRLHRVSAFKFLLSLDVSLKVCCGHGLSAFIHTPEQIDAAVHGQQKLPVLALAMDQGSSGFAASFFCHHFLKLQLCPLWDPSHRCSRDIELAYSQCGLLEVVHLFKIALNVNYGPFDGASFWRKLQEEASNYCAGYGPTCPLFQQLWPEIAQAMGYTEAEQFDTYFQRVFFEGIPESPAFGLKGPRLQTARWHSFLDVFRFWREHLPLRKLILTYHGIMEGWLLKKAGFVQSQGAPKGPVHEDAAKKSTSASVEGPDARLWANCANSLHVALLILMDPALLRRADIMWGLAKPLRDWHSDQSVFLRSPSHSVRFYVAMAEGQALGAIGGIFSCMKWVGLQGMGFVTSLTPALSALEAGSPEVLDEDSWMQLAGKLALLLAKHRFCGAPVPYNK